MGGWRLSYDNGTETIVLPDKYIGAKIPFDITLSNSYMIWAVWTERTVSSIKITYRENTLQSYFVDDALKSFTITVTYDNNETAKVTVTESMVSNFSTATTTGAKTATITYGGKTATFTYTVSAGYAYKVEHYQENADDDEYTLVSADTQTLYGVGTTEATAKTYTGFNALAFEQTEIAEDGTTVVKLYYDRNLYTITLDMQGGSGGTTVIENVKYGTQSLDELNLTKPTKNGYYFTGYYTAVNGGGFLFLDDAMSSQHNDIDANITVYAYWTERTVSKLEIPAASLTQSYMVDDAFVPFNITVAYNNGETETVQVTASMLDNFSTESAVTSATATVTHMGKTATFTYTVAARKYNLTYNVNGATGTGPLNQEVAEGTKVYLPSAGGLTKTGYTFGYWMYGDQILRVGDAFTMPADDVEIVAYWALNKPTLAGTAGGALNYTYKGSAYNVTVNPSHVLGNEVSYTFRWFRLNEGETNINSLYFSKDDLFEERCELLTTSSGTYGSYSFTNVVDSGVYYCVVTVTHGENTSQTAVEYTVSIAKVDQTITLSENEFTYSEGLTIDFADYVDGTGDGTLSFEISDKNGVAFDFANGVISNITKAGGTFTLTVNKAASDNYNAATETFTVTLNKGAQTLSVSGSPNPPTWKQEYQVSVSGNKGALSYAIISGNATVNESGVITATGTGQIRYSVTAAATNLYEAVTVERTVTFGKAAGNLAPDYATSKPTDLTICVGKTTDNITLPTGWSFASKTTFGQVGNITVSVTFTPSDTANYNSITENIVIAVADHTGGTAASCTSDQTCTKCGEVLVEALGHNYNEQVDNTVRTTAANCQECNTYWYDCSRCGASAKNDANATDKWYTSNEAGEHNMSSDWTSENGQHFHKCTVTGCDHTDTKVNCSGGTPTCQAKAVCSTCHQAYGNIGDHSYDMSAWGYKGTDGHAHVCTVSGCDAHDTVVGHTPNVDAATEETAKYCTVCDFVIEQQLNHVHSEGTEWKYDSEHHWHDCVGNDGQVYSKAEHTYDNACDTTCNVCNATRTITHDYSKLEKNDTEHWYVCSVCGSEKANSRTGHSGGTKDCQHKAECATCGQIYGDFGDHAYDTTVWVSVDNEHHAHKCMLCDAYTDETEHFSLDEATYTEDKHCDACGHKMADALGFELNNVVYKILTNEEGNYTVEVYGNTLTEATEVIIPATVNDEGIEYTVVSIGEDAFRNSTYLTGVTICEGVGSIAKSAFENCNALLYAELPQSIYAIGIGAFCNCSELRMVNIPYTVNVIEEWTFNGCHKLENIEIHESISKIGYRAFYNCYTLPSVVIPYSVETLNKNAFYGCTGLEEMRIYSMKVAIGENAIPTDIPVVYCEGAESTAAKYCAENGISFQTHEGEHVDKDKNHICDYGCSEALGVCEDNNFDHNCDYGCEKTCGEHSDGDDNNHLCDYGCQKIADDGCYDSEPVDGSCDECGAPIEHNHTGGNATCTEKAVCMICGQSYGEFAEHTFGNTWEYKDATGHAHVCTVKGCNEHDEIKAHTPNIPAATEESAQYCTACQYQMAAQLNHTHSPATEWTSNATHHWKACGGCDEHLEEAPHSYDPNNACDTTCEVCNAVREVSHDFTGEWEKDASGHWHVCTKNGCSVTDTKQNHVSAGAATETDPEVCSICGWQIAPALGHTTHTPEAEWQKNETHHWHECTGCDGQELNKAAHEYDNNCDTDCNVCGAPRTVAHDFTGEWQKDASGHWHVCATNGCSVTDTKQNHESAGAATETNPEVCSVCRWVINPALGHTTHTPEAEWQKNETHHWHECTGCDGQELDKAAHNDGNNDGSCDTCGYAMGTTPPPHTHSHGSTWVTDANEHWNECECGDKANKAAHADGNSDGKCDTCNYELGTSTPIDPDTPPVDNPPTDDNDGLGTGAIIGIVVAAVAVVGGGGFALFWFVIRKKRGF